MTVRQVIAALQLYDPDTVCVVNLANNEFSNGKEWRAVRAVPVYRWHNGANWHEEYFPETEDEDDDKETGTVVDITA